MSQQASTTHSPAECPALVQWCHVQQLPCQAPHPQVLELEAPSEPPWAQLTMALVRIGHERDTFDTKSVDAGADKSLS